MNTVEPASVVSVTIPVRVGLVVSVVGRAVWVVAGRDLAAGPVLHSDDGVFPDARGRECASRMLAAREPSDPFIGL